MMIDSNKRMTLTLLHCCLLLIVYLYLIHQDGTMTYQPPMMALTGINGFIATHIALTFLHNGWSVRGSVRTGANQDLVMANPIYKEYVREGKLEVVVLENLATADTVSFLRGCKAVSENLPVVPDPLTTLLVRLRDIC